MSDTYPPTSIVWISEFVFKSYTMTLLSYAADASLLLFGKKRTALTIREWPSSMCSRASVLASRTMTYLSSDAGASFLPSSENCTALTTPE